MTAGKVLIGGTAYDIKGGKTFIGGAAYDIKGGKTLIGGTAYDISFAPPREQTIEALMSQAVLIDIDGRDSSATGQVKVTIPSSNTGTYYAFGFYGKYMSINKIVFDGSTATKTILMQLSDTYGNVYTAVQTLNGNSLLISYGAKGTGTSTVRGATVAVFQFGGGYTTQEIDSILAAQTYADWAGHAGTSRSEVYKNSGVGTAYVFVAYSAYVSFIKNVSKQITLIYGNNTSYPKLAAYLTYSSWEYLTMTTNGTSKTTAYVGSMVTVNRNA